MIDLETPEDTTKNKYETADDISDDEKDYADEEKISIKLFKQLWEITKPYWIKERKKQATPPEISGNRPYLPVIWSKHKK